MRIKVLAIKQYGREVYYPANEAALLLARIANTKTLTSAVLTDATKLGHSIDVEVETAASAEWRVYLDNRGTA